MLTFGLGAETFGVQILRVKEIRGWSAVTPLPYSPHYVLGVLNLRGSIVPIIDLRRRFNLEAAEFSQKTVIIVLTLQTAKGRRDVGMVVDRVADVVDIDVAAVKPPPMTHSILETGCIAGLATVQNDMLILLDVDQLIAREFETPGLQGAA
jgi:purine-binding chemotaxis protein CheW